MLKFCFISILPLMFCRGLKLIRARDLEAKFGQDFEV